MQIWRLRGQKVVGAYFVVRRAFFSGSDADTLIIAEAEKQRIYTDPTNKQTNKQTDWHIYFEGSSTRKIFYPIHAHGLLRAFAGIGIYIYIYIRTRCGRAWAFTRAREHSQERAASALGHSHERAASALEHSQERAASAHEHSHERAASALGHSHERERAWALTRARSHGTTQKLHVGMEKKCRGGSKVFQLQNPYYIYI